MTTKEEGWLYKLSWTNLHRSWQRRYYVLQGRELRCYKKPDDHKPSSTIDLKHYVRVNMYPSKHSQWTFRLETGCRYHKSHLLCGETEAESRSWIHTIAARIHPEHSSQLCAPGEHHLKQYYQQHYNNHSHPSVDEDDIDEEIISDYGSSVLDKWLERLDLQDDPSKKSTSSISSVTPSSTLSTSIPTSIPSTAAGPLSTSLPALSSTISTTDETISRPPSSNSVSSNNNNNNGGSASAALADVFAQTRAAVKRRVTVSNGSQSPPLPPLPPLPPPLPRRSEDVFQFEQHDPFEQSHHSMVPTGDRYSRTAMMIPPSRPPPTTALPPPPPPPRPK
ncbi:PH domain-like protein [Lichtheimia hyalospora FSU 10163]|nr:PH domain-like protein [Lichtheimia hyalospora FSU 10163]